MSFDRVRNAYWDAEVEVAADAITGSFAHPPAEFTATLAIGGIFLGGIPHWTGRVRMAQDETVVVGDPTTLEAIVPFEIVDPDADKDLGDADPLE